MDFNRTIVERMRNLLLLKHLLLAVFLHTAATYMTTPVVIDVTMAALCEHTSQSCNRAMYLTGLQQVVTGIGTCIMTPIFGGLSDHHGRKPMLLLVLGISIFPYALCRCYVVIPVIICFTCVFNLRTAILSYRRTKEFVYAYYLVDTLASVMVDGSISCLTLAYVADTVDGDARSPIFGIVTGILSLAYVLSTLAARVIPEPRYIFELATTLSVASTIYMKIFLAETVVPGTKESYNELQYGRRQVWLNTMGNFYRNLTASSLLIQVTIITFFCGIAEAGLQGVLWYYLKTTFNFGKNQFSEMMLIGGATSVLLQLVVMPALIPVVGEKMILCAAVFGDFLHAILYSVAWAPWVPYFSASAASLHIVIYSSVSSIVSKHATPEQQGKVQGIVSGARSLATIVSPIAVTPLSAIFLSDNPPFRCRGFSILCLAFALLIALVQGCLLRQPAPPLCPGSKYVQVSCEEEKHVAQAPLLLV